MWIMRTFALCVVILASSAVAGQSVYEAGAPSSSELDAWIEQLGASRFAIREQAADRLTQAGTAAIGRLAQRASGGDIETSFRALEVLREMALRDSGDAEEAEQALRSLAERELTAASRQATLVLDSLRNVRTTQALRILRRLGATISSSGITYDEKNLGAGIVFLTFGKGWRGTTEDLQLVGWLVDYAGVHVTLQGRAFDSASLEQIADLPMLVSLQLNRTSMTDESMSYVERMTNLRVLSIRYCEFTDACLDYVDKLNGPLSFSVFGKGISRSAFEKVVARHSNWTSRYGRGGFLGIAGSASRGNIAGCYVSYVTPNEAASAAGIRKGDIITAYNDQTVTQFVPARRGFPIPVLPDDRRDPTKPSLSELIGENEPGDKVKVSVRRGRSQFELDVVLGEWP